MTSKKDICEGCNKVYRLKSLNQYQGKWLCYRCRIKRWSWRIMKTRAWQGKKEIDELEGGE